MSLPVFLLVCAVANLWAFLVFGWDKLAARSGWSRVRERTLLALTLAGGLGAMAASSLFRHKTRKQPFRRWAICLAALHLLIVALVMAVTFPA